MHFQAKIVSDLKFCQIQKKCSHIYEPEQKSDQIKKQSEDAAVSRRYADNNTIIFLFRESGVGAGIDSYYEYVAKAYVLLGEEKASSYDGSPFILVQFRHVLFNS